MYREGKALLINEMGINCNCGISILCTSS